MMGHKTLAEIRAELEEALGDNLAAPKPPAEILTSPGRLTAWESLRQFVGQEQTEARDPEPNAALRPIGQPSRPRAEPRRRKRRAGG